MNDEQRKLLTDLRDKLEEVGKSPALRGKFDLDTWLSAPGLTPLESVPLEDRSVERVITEKALQTCGTHACAIGWGAGLPSWKAAGFCLACLRGEPVAWPIFRGYDGFGAVERFLGLSGTTVNYLFMPHMYDAEETRDPLAVVARINDVLERGY